MPLRAFTIALPIRDTDAEYTLMNNAIESALALKPHELMIGLDGDASPRLVEKATLLAKNFTHKWARDEQEAFHLSIIHVPRTTDWNFQLAHVVYEMYQRALHNQILSFDVDSILTRNVLIGLEFIGKRNVGVVSFTKKLRTATIQNLIRYGFYRLRVRMSDSVFSGVYWVHRPYYFSVMSMKKLRVIRNGVDTLLCEAFRRSSYKIITRKEIGVLAMTLQNEDLAWTQFQTGIWFYANYGTKSRRVIQLTLQIILYQRWWYIIGFLWAHLHRNSSLLTRARQLSYDEWGYLGRLLTW